ncbi:hypothetical protein SAMN04488023_13251 [Pedobacter rhizosphaerae]|uniref:Uncharacterized protein n=1 Tax=Pedobacter rhizosphaerae TaxID=390241 RepID=A0A1H9UNY0_9SPHI|nr:hypothetical protein SAMN04488023_13251 [Pedobacter rhizosphaerae]
MLTHEVKYYTFSVYIDSMKLYTGSNKNVRISIFFSNIN